MHISMIKGDIRFASVNAKLKYLNFITETLITSCYSGLIVNDRSTQMVKWPAVIKYHSEDELIYVESLTEWKNDPGLCLPHYESEDRLIDASGALFSLPVASSPLNTDMFVSLDCRILVSEFVELIRKHAVIENYCCSAKLNAKTYQQVIAMVKEINSL